MRDDCRESSRLSESSDVQLVDDVIAEWQTKPAGIVPSKGFFHNLRWTVDALGLKPRRGIGPVFAAIEAVEVERARGYSCDLGLKVSGCRYL